MKKISQATLLILSLMLFAAAPVSSYAADAIQLNSATADQLAATGAVDKATAEKIVNLREELGGFQSFDDLGELSLPADQMNKLKESTAIQGISSDCNC